MPFDEPGTMDRDTIIRVFTANVDHWVHVRTVHGVHDFMFVVNVDDEGYVNKAKANDDDEYWTTFDDIEAVWPAGDLTATETD